MSLVKILREFTILEDFSDKDLRLLATFVEESEYDDEQIILDKKTGGKALYFVLSGKVGIRRELPGKICVTTELGKHEIFGEVAFSDQGTRTADVFSMGKSVIGVFQFEHFDIIKKQDPVFGMHFLLTLLKQLAKKFRAIYGNFDDLFKTLISGGK